MIGVELFGGPMDGQVFVTDYREHSTLEFPTARPQPMAAYWIGEGDKIHPISERIIYWRTSLVRNGRRVFAHETVKIVGPQGGMDWYDAKT